MTKWQGLAALAALSCFLSPVPTARREGGNPMSALVRDAADERTMRGRVEERLMAGHYSYLALRTAAGARRWVVTMGRGEPVGADVAVRSFGHVEHFHSRRLRRDFPSLAFGIVSRRDTTREEK